MSGACTGHFVGFPGVVCAFGFVGDGEFTLCGDAFDAGETGDLDGAGAWVEHDRKRPVTCVQCKAIISNFRTFRLSPKTERRAT